ncbi:MAG: hypothetical protein V4648_08550 [Bacteroidota bacterium]
MIQLYRGEQFKEIELNPAKQLRYAISNQGRMISFSDDMKNGRELKGGLLEGYKVFQHVYKTNGVKKQKSLFFYRLVAQYFLPKGNEDQTFVLHLDFDKQNDRVENLKWANQVELTAHHSVNPAVIRGKAKTTAFNIKADGRKLTSTQVIRIKKMLQRDNKTRLVMIAKQFNITTQQLYRIRTGENWGHIKV